MKNRGKENKAGWKKEALTVMTMYIACSQPQGSSKRRFDSTDKREKSKSMTEEMERRKEVIRLRIDSIGEKKLYYLCVIGKTRMHLSTIIYTQEWRKICLEITATEVSELQGEKPQKRSTPPLQPKRLGRIDSFFGERPFMWILSDSPRRFLNFILRAEIWPKNRKFLNPDLTPSKTTRWAHISASRMKFKNRLGESESIHMKGLSPKNEPIRPRRLGCRGGAPIFEAFHLVFQSFL